MKLLRLASIALATSAFLPMITSCSSDPNPFEKNIPTNTDEDEGQSAYIRLNLRVEDTRAEDLSMASENAIKKINIYVFNEKHELETTKTNLALGTEENSVVLEVSHGRKTVYVITSDSGIDPAEGISLTDFERLTFDSTLAKLRTSNGHVMIGKSNEQQVMISSSKDDMPDSNNFSIKLTRLAAKAQVKCASLGQSSFGIILGTAEFKASQTCDKMMVVHNGSDIFSSFTQGNNSLGTYDNYSIREDAKYLSAVTSDFTAAGCEYMAENIVTTPLSGNTTFLSIKISTTAENNYSFSESDTTPQVMAEKPFSGANYYVVGIVDRERGVSDYTVDSDSHIITFKTEEDAQRYANSLNSGEVSPITVSQTESLLKAPAFGAPVSRATSQFEVFTFVRGDVYYRVNIAHNETNGDSTASKYKVVRNKFYKVTINSVKSLGVCSEDLLRPTDPATNLDAQGSSWINSSFVVEDWEEVEQNVDLH